MAENYYPSKSNKRDKRIGHNYSGKVDTRLDKAENAMLDRLAVINGTTRSDVMRRALRDYYRFCTDEEVED